MQPETETPIRVRAATAVGERRTLNEDASLLAPIFGDAIHDVGGGLVLGVFDGCGGVASGRVASDLAAETVLATLRSLGRERCRRVPSDALEESVAAANRAVFGLASSDRTKRGMSTSATVAALFDDTLHLAHVGDSRGYILRDRRLVQVSRDQTLLNQLIVDGKILPEEIAEFPHRHVTIGAIGTQENVAVDRTSVRLRRGDVLFLCTDGVHGPLSASAITHAILRDGAEASAVLLQEAEVAGGDDNATVVIARFDSGWLACPSDDDVLADRNDVTPPADAVSHRTAFPIRNPILED